MKKSRTGFTLIELLIVIAIIGVLAGVILLSTSQVRDKAQASDATQTMKSLMPHMVNCFFTGRTVNSVTAPVVGAAVCGSDNSLVFPALPANCNYANQLTAGTIRVICGTLTIVCDYSGNGNCIQS